MVNCRVVLYISLLMTIPTACNLYTTHAYTVIVAESNAIAAGSKQLQNTWTEYGRWPTVNRITPQPSQFYCGHRANVCYEIAYLIFHVQQNLIVSVDGRPVSNSDCQIFRTRPVVIPTASLMFDQ